MYNLIYIVLIDFWRLFNFFFYICLNGFDNLIADFYILAIEKSIFFQIIFIFFKNIIINPLIALGLVEMTIPDKPNREGNH